MGDIGDVLACEDFDDDDIFVGKAKTNLTQRDNGGRDKRGSQDLGLASPRKGGLTLFSEELKPPPATYATGLKPATFAPSPATLPTYAPAPAPAPASASYATGTTGVPSQDSGDPLDKSYKLQVPLTEVPPPATRPKTPSGLMSSFFGRGPAANTLASPPLDAVLAERAESHFAGVMDDPRSCKILGKASVWLTCDQLVVNSSGGTFTWRLEDLKVCRRATSFEHGEFKILDASKLGDLLEMQGRCVQPPDGDNAKNALAKMAVAGHVHIGIRGLSNVDAWVARIGHRDGPKLPQVPL